jgi:hypothetical protein
MVGGHNGVGVMFDCGIAFTWAFSVIVISLRSDEPFDFSDIPSLQLSI